MKKTTGSGVRRLKKKTRREKRNEELEPTVFSHKAVLVDPVLTYLDLKKSGVYLDVTFGSGGHTRAILEKEPTATVIALDWDARSIEQFGRPLIEEFGSRLRLVWGNFALLYSLVKKEKIPAVDGILADFGTSQMQLIDRPGFSFSRDSILDMRMSPAHQPITAEQVLATSTERKLLEIFSQLGQEQYAKQIARAIVEARRRKRIQKTGQLVDIIQGVVPPYSRRLHSATKVFQALRLYVNRELSNISAFLPAAVAQLKPGGRLVCISFHSLEDRLVKEFFSEQQSLGALEVLTSRIVVADDEEVTKNPSARSAKLRAAQKKS